MTPDTLTPERKVRDIDTGMNLFDGIDHYQIVNVYLRPTVVLRKCGTNEIMTFAEGSPMLNNMTPVFP